MGAKLKVRQPLAQGRSDSGRSQPASVAGRPRRAVDKELNVKQVEFTAEGRSLHHLHRAARFETAWPAAGQETAAGEKRTGEGRCRQVAGRNGSRPARCRSTLDDGSSESLDRDDLQVRLQAKPGWAAAQGKACVVVLSTETIAGADHRGPGPRDCPCDSNQLAKITSCEYTDRIEVGIVTESADIRRAVEQFADYIRGETLADCN